MENFNSQEDFILKSEALFHGKKWNVALFKQFLYLLEDLRREHSINFDKLRSAIPEDYHDILDMGDYFDEQRFSAYRKKVLDLGNENGRNLEKDINNL